MLSPPFIEAIRSTLFHYNTGVKRLCDEHKISVSALERTLNFPRSSICKWNENEPGIRKVQKVADYFGVSIEKLLESYEEEEIDKNV